MLNDDTFSLPVKSLYTYKMLVKNLNLDTATGKLKSILCLTSMIIFLTKTNNIVGLSLFMKNLINAIRNGEISKTMVREIIKLLINAGLKVDSDLLDAVN